MEGAFAWLGAVFEWFGQWVPRWMIVDTTHGAIKFVRGSRVVVLGPGVHFFWPATTNFHAYPVVRQAVNLRSQTLMTKDEKTVVVSALVVYEVFDLEKLIAHTYDPDDTIKEISIGRVHRVLASKTWAEIRSGDLDKTLRLEVRKALDKYGVSVLEVTVTDLSICRAIKLFTSTSAD